MEADIAKPTDSELQELVGNLDNMEKFHECMKQKEFENLKDSEGRSLLHLTCLKSQNFEVANYLLKNVSSTSTRDLDNQRATAMMYACQNTMKTLVMDMFNIVTRNAKMGFLRHYDNNRRNVLHYCLINRPMADPEITNTGNELLQFLIDEAKVLLYLHSFSNWINQEDSENKTPVEYAIENQNIYAIKLFNANGGLCKLHGSYNLPPVAWIILKGDSEVKLMFKNLKNSQFSDKEILDCLYHIVNMHNLTYSDIIDLDERLEWAVNLTELIEPDAEILKILVQRGSTILGIAYEQPELYKELIFKLVNKGAKMFLLLTKQLGGIIHHKVQLKFINKNLDSFKSMEGINEKDSTGQRPLHYTTTLTFRTESSGTKRSSDQSNFDENFERIKLAKELIEMGAEVNAQDNLGKTPLYYAVENQHEDMVDLLLESKADPKIKTIYNLTALTIASKKTKDKLIEKVLSSYTENLYSICAKNLSRVQALPGLKLTSLESETLIRSTEIARGLAETDAHITKLHGKILQEYYSDFCSFLQHPADINEAIQGLREISYTSVPVMSRSDEEEIGESTPELLYQIPQLSPFALPIFTINLKQHHTDVIRSAFLERFYKKLTKRLKVINIINELEGKKYENS